MQIISTAPRPIDLSVILLKHSLTEARDCELFWKANFGTMELLLYTSFISPVLLLDFIAKLPKRDERFQQTGIEDVVQISAHFSIKLILQSDGKDICYRVRIFRVLDGFSREPRYGLELM